MRISKAPEERKQEMIDTAMKLFAQKGYEATTMTDIAKEMNVVSGLCYRYFKSKEALYHEALQRYAAACAQPMIAIMNREYDSLEEYIEQMRAQFFAMQGREKYHDFFHEKGNEIFHSQLEYVMISMMVEPMTSLLKQMNAKNLLHIEDCRNTAKFMLYGQMPIINDESISAEERIRIISRYLNKILS